MFHLHHASSLRFAAAAVLLLVALAAFCGVLYTVVDARASIQSAFLSLSNTEKQQQSLQRAANLAKATTEERAQLMSLALAPGSGVAFIAALEDMGKTAHATISVSSVDATAPRGGKPGHLTLTAHMECSYSACMRFIELAETSPFALSISALSLTYDNVAKDWGGLVTLSVLSFDTP